MKCVHCGKDHPNDFKFCPETGKRLETEEDFPKIIDEDGDEITCPLCKSHKVKESGLSFLKYICKNCNTLFWDEDDSRYRVIELGNFNLESPDFKLIDLGLPSGHLWADRNIGAANNHDPGYYLAFGEAMPKDVYGSSSHQEEGDIVYSRYEGDWHSPDVEDLEELIDTCSWYSIEIRGRKVYVAEGPNGNKIYFPAGGYKKRFDFEDDNEVACLWSRDGYRNKDGEMLRYELYISGDGYPSIRRCPGFWGFNVRPVLGYGNY